MNDLDKALADLKYSDHFTDLSNADYFVALYGNEVRYDISQGRWYIWREHFWQEDRNNTTQGLIVASVRHRFTASRNIEDKDLQKLTRKWAVASESEARLTSLRRLLMKHEGIAVAGDSWNRNTALFATMNGVVNLQTGDFLDGVPSDMINQHSPTTFDPNAQAPRFRKFLDEIFDGDSELIYWMQKALGYSLTGENSEQLLFFCHGSGSNGKSVLFSILSVIMGTYGLTVPSSTFQRNIMNTQTNDVAMMQGKRFVMAAESLAATKMDEQKLKKISGGDTITARFLHHEFFEFQPLCKIWLFMNHMPMFDDDSYSFWRRVRLVPFLRTFKGDERDNQLENKLKAELPGILAWLVEGAQLWYAEGLSDTPDAITLATEEVRESNNRIIDFIGEWCEENPQVSEKASSLYTAYTRWSDQHNHQKRDILSQNAFGRLMSDKYKKVRTETGNHYQGICLQIEHKFK